MSPTLIALVFLALGLLASVFVVAALALSSQISEEAEEEQLVDTADAEQLTRFPRTR